MRDLPNATEYEFVVTVCLGGGDGGDVIVSVGVTPEEYDLLKQCYKDDVEVGDCDELKDLYEDICSEAITKAGCSEYDNPICLIFIPDEICDEAQEEMDAEEE